jgi:CRISPR/Cas system CSM-associated protein Csm5 (group 7 of RAMP superfamily)
MTKDEFKEKIQHVFMEFNSDKNYDFLLTAINRTPTNGHATVICIGFGCGGCIAEAISRNLDNFPHSVSDDEKLDEKTVN